MPRWIRASWLCLSSLLAVACGEVAPVSIDAAVPIDAEIDAASTFEVTVAKAGSGSGAISSAPAGITCGATCTASFPEGTSVVLTAAPDVGSTFLGWSGGGCNGTGTCTVTAATTVTAMFTVNANLAVMLAGNGMGRVVSLPVGIDCGADCEENYPSGTTVTLTAAPVGDSTFTGWSGAGCSGTGACIVTVDGATMVTASFTLNQYTLTITRPGNGAGSVASTPAGINCGSACSASFDSGAMVTLTATAAAGSTFAGWTGGGCSGVGDCVVTMSAVTSVAANFQLTRHDLTVTRLGTGTGTVTSTPAGITCGADCVETYNYGTTVRLDAAPAAGSTFGGWGGACSGTATTCTVSITAATSVTATFSQSTVTLTVTKSGIGAGTVTSSPAGINCPIDCTEPYATGSSVVLSARATGSGLFTGWGGSCSGTATTCTVSMTAARSVTASFGDQVGTPTDLGGNSSHSPNFLLGQQITVSTAGTLYRFGLISRSTGGPRVRMALYAQTAAGEPGTLVAQTATAGTAMTTGTMLMAPITSVTIPAGNYWLVAVYDMSASVGWDSALTVPTKYISLPFANALPSPFGTVTNYNGGRFNYWIVLQ